MNSAESTSKHNADLSCRCAVPRHERDAASRTSFSGLAVLLLLFSTAAYCEGSAEADGSYSPYVGEVYPDKVYWGDLHVHTSVSTDAYSYGNTQLSPNDAYSFARGRAVNLSNGGTGRLQRPLDFLAVADHAENLGFWVGLQSADRLLLRHPVIKECVEQYAREWRTESDKERRESMVEAMSACWQSEGRTDRSGPAYVRKVWHDTIDAADAHYSPGVFTTFAAFEWTPFSEYGYGFHRVVLFMDGASKVKQVMPFSAIESDDPEDLWKYMEGYSRMSGGKVLAIPHNSNLTGGLAFALFDHAGEPFTPQYASLRQRWEPLLEITQMKGDSETHPILSPTDEFADFETYLLSITGEYPPNDLIPPGVPVETYDYARSGLKLGLAVQEEIGVNPFKFGFVGSTDSHSSLSTADNDNYLGDRAATEPSPDRMKLPWSWEKPAAGYTGVWATENTREALFEAMIRKETYATTGPRMAVRFFGGWAFGEGDALEPNLALRGYKSGVPMGGDLTKAPNGKAPTFLIRAVKDPVGANLDRVQVVKGWRSADGELHEKVYDVAVSDGRLQGPGKKVEPIASTVDVEKATYTNSVGAPELATVWRDPDFNAAEAAFYYLRVLEIPTPRWTAYDVARFNLSLDDLPEGVPLVTQERAYSSPIWYKP